MSTRNRNRTAHIANMTKYEINYTLSGSKGNNQTLCCKLQEKKTGLTVCPEAKTYVPCPKGTEFDYKSFVEANASTIALQLIEKLANVNNEVALEVKGDFKSNESDEKEISDKPMTFLVFYQKTHKNIEKLYIMSSWVKTKITDLS